MLPRRIPEIPGGEIAVRYHAAWSGREVGGDWYDVIALPSGRIGVVVGDVQGHDTHAAAIMGQLRIALRAYAGEGHPPSTVLARASRFLAELDTDRFATCTYAQVDLATGAYAPSRAGPPRAADPAHGRASVGWPTRARRPAAGPRHDLRAARSSPRPGSTWCPARPSCCARTAWSRSRAPTSHQGMEALAHAVRERPARRRGAGRPPLGPALGALGLAATTWRCWSCAGPGPGHATVRRASTSTSTRRTPRVCRRPATPLRQALRDWGIAGARGRRGAGRRGAAGQRAAAHGRRRGADAGGAAGTGPADPAVGQDRSSVWPRRRTPGEAATSGRGLLLVDAVADRWGVEPRGDGKAVWCEFGPAS